jgi:aminoglycoside-2''-adenylyltransferase
VTEAAAQLAAISRIAASLGAEEVDYWVFGGWAVDLHAGRITRPHHDIDIAVWGDELERASALLTRDGWQRESGTAGDGLVAFRDGEVRLELAYVDREEHAEWPAGAFGNDVGRVDAVSARVVSRTALLANKSIDYGNAATAAKDQADVAILRALDP